MTQDQLPAGFLCYPISQAADILAFGADVVPVGEDQNPMIEQTNEIARRFNSVYEIDCFKEVRPLLGQIGRLPGIDGKSKMSKSLGNAIYLKDPADDIRKKVNQMFTDPNHLRVEDPGKVEGNVVFMFLDFFDEDKLELEQLKIHYQAGGLGDGILKRRLVDKLESLTQPIRKRRFELEAERPYIRRLLLEGSMVAREVASKKVGEVKRAMKLYYE